jgi:prepilin-type N-terminal cleavage/methylation domain-containing protein
MKNTSATSHSQAGFTLIEVMISLFVLVLIGVTTSKAVLDAAKLKEVLKDETEFASEYRTSMGFIERDLNQVFNPRWLLPPDQKPYDPYAQPAPVAPQNPGAPASAAKQTLPPDQLNRFLKGFAFQTFEYWGMVYDQTGIRPSRFKGTDNSFSFVAASHTRIYQQKKESIYAKIKYSLIPQPPNPNLNKEQNEKLKGLFSLIKEENTHAFELEEPKDAPYVNYYTILNNIKKFKIGYYKTGEKDPVTSWDSDAVDTKGIFPEALEIEVSLQGPNDRTMDAKVLFKLETPNDVLPATY